VCVSGKWWSCSYTSCHIDRSH